MKTPLELKKRINNLRMALELRESGAPRNRHETATTEYAFYDRGANVIDHFPLTDYTESFEENLAQIENEQGDSAPAESFLRLSRSVENMHLKFMQEGIHLKFSDEDKLRLYLTTADLFKRLTSGHLKLDHYYALCSAMPELAMICTDYPETLNMQKMQEFNNREPSFFKTIRAQVAMPHISKAGHHLIYIAGDKDAEDDAPLMLAENRNGKTHCWTVHYTGSKEEILQCQRADAKKAAQHYGRDTDVYRDYIKNNKTILEFIDLATHTFKNGGLPPSVNNNPT